LFLNKTSRAPPTGPTSFFKLSDLLFSPLFRFPSPFPGPPSIRENPILSHGSEENMAHPFPPPSTSFASFFLPTDPLWDKQTPRPWTNSFPWGAFFCMATFFVHGFPGVFFFFPPSPKFLVFFFPAPPFLNFSWQVSLHPFSAPSFSDLFPAFHQGHRRSAQFLFPAEDFYTPLPAVYLFLAFPTAPISLFC